MVGKNLQQLEVGEEQTRVREEKLQAQIMDLRYIVYCIHSYTQSHATVPLKEVLLFAPTTVCAVLTFLIYLET